MAARPERAIERCVEAILDAPDPSARALALLAGARELSGAHAAALCRPLPSGGWAAFALAGDPAALPAPEQIAAVAGGVLAPWLPPRRAVRIAHARLALALAGVAEDEPGLDELDGVLAVYAAIADTDPGPAGLEEVQGPRPTAAGDVEDDGNDGGGSGFPRIDHEG